MIKKVFKMEITLICTNREKLNLLLMKKGKLARRYLSLISFNLKNKRTSVPNKYTSCTNQCQEAMLESVRMLMFVRLATDFYFLSYYFLCWWRYKKYITFIILKVNFINIHVYVYICNMYIFRYSALQKMT